jgi:hypothetical protein
MLDEIKPDIDFSKYKNAECEVPPFQELKQLIRKADSQKAKIG